MRPVVELAGVCAGYGRVEVLRDLDLVVPEGALVSLVGPNGAGKTTTLRVIAGLLRPSAGEVRLDGRRLGRRQPFEVARDGVCLIPEGRGIFPALTVRENLAMQLYGPDPDGSRLDRAFTYFPRLRERAGQRAGTLSGGEQQMLAMARAVVNQPRVLLLDEISMGLAPLIVEQLFETVAALAAAGTTILLVEQYMTYALRLSDLVYVLAKGRVAFVGEPEELVASGALAAF
ncbi:MAG: livF [Actinomycetia bacterium]|nr:livF [Actinomycetes bacterium]